MSTDTEVDELYKVANDYQADVLDDLRKAAGHVWVCRDDRWRNLIGDDTCGSCNKARAAVDEDLTSSTPMMCENCRDAVTWDADAPTVLIGSDGETTCPEVDRPHGPAVPDTAIGTIVDNL